MSKVKVFNKVVFVRHGQSVWNLENKFTGWHDIGLTEQGNKEAFAAGELLNEKGFKFDVCHTSVLRRAINTWNNIAEVTNHHHIPVHKTYRLNERHYGGLTGLNKAETAAKHGDLEDDDPRHPKNDSMYDTLPKDVLPGCESLELTVKRALPYWFDHICPHIKEGKKVVVAAHGNSLRAIVMYLSGMSKEEILQYNIPTGIPFVYEFDKDLNVLDDYYLIDEEELKRRQEEVANQGKA